MTSTSGEPAGTGTGAASLAKDVGFLLFRNSSVIRKRTKDHLHRFGLRVHHYTVLSACDGSGGYPQRDLAALLNVAQSQIVTLTSELERKGLVTRDVDSRDARALSVRTTAAGQAMMQEASDSLQETNNQFLSVLTSHERHALIGLLQRIGRVPSENG